jgi:hypothetical protein
MFFVDACFAKISEQYILALFFDKKQTRKF